MNRIERSGNKKLIVGISIIFSIIILIGGTYAFFSSNKSQNDLNLVTVDINNKLNFVGNPDEIRDGLVPIELEDVEKAYQKDQDRCIDDIGQSACSIYQFYVENIADVSQKINISMHPTANSFTNLYYRMYEKVGNEYVLVKEDSKINNLDSEELVNNVLLSQNQKRTYEIVYYVLNKEYDQTIDDAGKNFGAGIRVDSVATGQYKLLEYGAHCWDTELIEGTENEYKLTKFNGIDNNEYAINSSNQPNTNYGNIDEGCTGFVKKTGEGENRTYSIEIPSNFGGKNITTIGEKLFSNDYLKFLEGESNYTYIEKINIKEGITTIEKKAFEYVGVSRFGFTILLENGTSVNFPSTLKYIGERSFQSSTVKFLTIPSSVEEIGDYAFIISKLITELTFLMDDEMNSSLKSIGEEAFYGCHLESSSINPLVIPKSVETIGNSAFGNNNSLTHIKYFGPNLNTNWYNSWAVTIIRS